MDQSIESKVRIEAQEDEIIVLGVASVETLGGRGMPVEGMGMMTSGIADE
jgi:hypothetical protein